MEDIKKGIITFLVGLLLATVTAAAKSLVDVERLKTQYEVMIDLLKETRDDVKDTRGDIKAIREEINRRKNYE